VTVTDRDEAASSPDVGPPTAPPRGRRRRVRPAARFEPGRVAEPRPRNPIWLVAGVLLVVLSALGGVLLFTANDDRVDVVVAATDLLPGQPVERTDLRIAQVGVDEDVATVSPAGVEDLLGRQPTGRIPAGTLLSPGMFADELALGPDEVVVGAALDPGEAPLSGIQVGVTVELLAIEAGAEAPAPDAPAVVVAATPIGTGTIWAVEPIATGQLWLSMRVDREVGLAASLASAQDALRVVLVGGAG